MHELGVDAWQDSSAAERDGDSTWLSGRAMPHMGRPHKRSVGGDCRRIINRCGRLHRHGVCTRCCGRRGWYVGWGSIRRRQRWRLLNRACHCPSCSSLRLLGSKICGSLGDSRCAYRGRAPAVARSTGRNCSRRRLRSSSTGGLEHICPGVSGLSDRSSLSRSIRGGIGFGRRCLHRARRGAGPIHSALRPPGRRRVMMRPPCTRGVYFQTTITLRDHDLSCLMHGGTIAQTCARTVARERVGRTACACFEVEWPKDGMEKRTVIMTSALVRIVVSMTTSAVRAIAAGMLILVSIPAFAGIPRVLSIRTIPPSTTSAAAESTWH
jgi:hypothetical protein